MTDKYCSTRKDVEAAETHTGTGRGKGLRQGCSPEVVFGNLCGVSYQDVVLNDGHSETEAGVKEEDQHEDVVEDSIAIIIRTAQVTSGVVIFLIQE